MATAAPAKEELNPFEIAKQQFNRAADFLELEESMRAPKAASVITRT